MKFKVSISNVIFGATTVCAIAIASAAFSHSRAGNMGQQYREVAPELLSVQPNRLFDAHRDNIDMSHNPFVLVECGDYQCPPCRMLSKSVAEILQKRQGKLAFAFRQYPLSFHPYAMEAAVTAEAARIQGKFPEMHTALYNADFYKPGEIDRIVNQIGLDKRRLQSDKINIAPTVVKSDMAMFRSLGFNGTPTFVLCCPDNRVYKLSHLSQVDNFLN